MRRLVLTVTLIGALCVSVAITAAPVDSPVADAAMRGNIEGVRALLQKGADVNAAHGDGMTPLHWAAERSDAAMAEMLIYAGANVTAVTRIGQYTPLHVASTNGSSPVVDMLIEAGADVSARTTNSGVTALHLAAASGNTDVITALIGHGSDVNAVESKWEQTPLIFAASQNRVDASRVLLEHDADPGIASKIVDLLAEGRLVNAARDLQRDVLDSFQEPTPSQVQAAVLAARDLYLSGEVPERRGRGRGGRGGAAAGQGGQGGRRNRPPAVTKTGGLTPLLHAARQGYADTAMALIDGGADVNQVSGADATSPLLIAVINAQFDLAMQLLERGADPNLADSVHNAAPLWAAVNAEWQPRTRFPQPQEHGLQQATYLDVMRVLLEAGADPDNRLTKHPWYMTYTGCGNGNCGLEDTNGSTAFWRAAYGTDVDAMRLLVEYDADPDIPSKAPAPRPPRGGTTADNTETPPLLQPAGPGLWPATNARGIGPDASGLPKIKEGGPGVYPIHAASGVGYGEGFTGNAHRHAPDAWMASVKYLIEELGVDVNARDFGGYTPLHHAAARGDNQMILYLVEKGADVTVVARNGQTTADMANGPVQRVSPFPETVALLEKLGSKNNNNCVVC